MSKKLISPEQREKNRIREIMRRAFCPEVRKDYNEKNKEKLNEKARIYAREHAIERKKYSKAWFSNNPDKHKEYNEKWKKDNREVYLKKRKENHAKLKISNPLYDIKNLIRKGISSSFKRNSKNYNKTRKTEEILGCTLEFFIDYILNKCPEGISLKDFGRYGYHLDHIIPISLAKNTEEIIKLSHYTNFQPLWWEENLKKSNKIL